MPLGITGTSLASLGRTYVNVDVGLVVVFDGDMDLNVGVSLGRAVNE